VGNDLEAFLSLRVLDLGWLQDRQHPHWLLGRLTHQRWLFLYSAANQRWAGAAGANTMTYKGAWVRRKGSAIENQNKKISSVFF